MANKCRVCTHRDKAKIDEEIVRGAALRELGRRYGIGKDSMYRHAQSHVPQAIAKAAEAEALADGNGLLNTVKYLEEKYSGILQHAEEKKDYRLALQTLRQIRSLAELKDKVRGELERGKVTSLHQSVTLINPSLANASVDDILKMLSGN